MKTDKRKNIGLMCSLLFFVLLNVDNDYKSQQILSLGHFPNNNGAWVCSPCFPPKVKQYGMNQKHV